MTMVSLVVPTFSAKVVVHADVPAANKKALQDLQAKVFKDPVFKQADDVTISLRYPVKDPKAKKPELDLTKVWITTETQKELARRPVLHRVASIKNVLEKPEDFQKSVLANVKETLKRIQTRKPKS